MKVLKEGKKGKFIHNLAKKKKNIYKLRESKDILLILYIYFFLLHYSHDLIKKEREKKKLIKW